MNEDERYRTSTQYRLWSFTPEKLASLRETTNQAAAERVKEAIHRARASRAASASASGETSEVEPPQNGTPHRALSNEPLAEVKCLTPEEELQLVTYYCRQTLDLGDHLKVPTDVKATAIQYLKRFYITNSVMTYHPTSILKTALFFATKTENHYFRLTKFADAIDKTRAEDVLASEFLLTQGLRFTFDVRHPFRALEGSIMELQALAKAGNKSMDTGVGMAVLPGTSAPRMPVEWGDGARRVREAHGRARELLKTSALLTDVYFHYTPAQIMFATLLLVDEELTTWYLHLKMPSIQSSSSSSSSPAVETALLPTLRACATILRTVPPTTKLTPEELAHLKRMVKKLQRCRNPDMADLVKVSERRKREGGAGVDGNGGLDQAVVKKRKVEREEAEKKEGEELFGPRLG